jgi:hypothetical protein
MSPKPSPTPSTDHSPALIPHRLPLAAQQDVQQWLELIAGLYVKAVNQ